MKVRSLSRDMYSRCSDAERCAGTPGGVSSMSCRTAGAIVDSALGLAERTAGLPQVRITRRGRARLATCVLVRCLERTASRPLTDQFCQELHRKMFGNAPT